MFSQIHQREIILSQQGKSMQRISDFAPIEEALLNLDGDLHARVLLSDDDGNYVRVLGRKDLLAICHGRSIDNQLSHYMLSLSKRDEEEMTFSFGTVTTQIQKNDLMALEDALLLAQYFFEQKDFPPAYNMREIEKPLF
ncbi:MAG: hypothetical protein R8P61_03755 [Bacteroidia bacterium]|nr:hypothetical protein [Bacteroidia bacterium]